MILEYLIYGLIFGSIICSLWNIFFGHIPAILSIREKTLKIVEHYHHGLLLFILSLFLSDIYRSILFGIGTILILDESNNSNAFAYGKDTFKVSSILGFLLFFIYLMFLIYL